MTLAFLLITTRVGHERKIVEKLLEFEEIKEANILFGEYDIVAKIQTKTNSDLQAFIIDKIRVIDGVMQTSALIAADAY